MFRLSLKLILGAVLFIAQQPPAPQSEKPEKSEKTEKTEKKVKPAVPVQPALTARVVVVSILGLGADFLADAIEKGASIPNLSRAQREGGSAAMLEGVYPSLILPSHATMLSGMLPADHGIFSDHPFDEASGSTIDTVDWKLSDIKVATILEAAASAGVTVESHGFPLVAETGSSTCRGSCIELYTIRDLDAAETRYGPDSREALAALEVVDRKLARILTEAEDKATVLILSDSGREPIEREFRPNVILAKKKFLSATADGKVAAWRAVCQSFGGSAGVRVKDLNDDKLIAEVEKTFKEEHEKSESPIWRVIDKRSAARLGADPRIAFYLDASPNYAMSERANGDSRENAAIRGAAGYLPQRSTLRGVLIAWGVGIKPGSRLEYTRLVDIAPTVARLLGLELKLARGRVLNEVLVQ